MKKLIELDAAIKETWKDTGYTDPLNVMTAIRDRLKALPTVDAVPVVRCKDCRYWDVSPASTAAPAYHECKARASRLGRVHTTAEEFCSRGERKDGDNHDTV